MASELALYDSKYRLSGISLEMINRLFFPGVPVALDDEHDLRIRIDLIPRTCDERDEE